MNDAAPHRGSLRSQSWRLTQPWKVQPPHLLTIDEAAAMLGLTPATVRRYCDDSKIGYIVWRWRHGVIARARRYVPKAALREFLERRRATQ